jgi:hypothetical protein
MSMSYDFDDEPLRLLANVQQRYTAWIEPNESSNLDAWLGKAYRARTTYIGFPTDAATAARSDPGHLQPKFNGMRRSAPGRASMRFGPH